MSANTMRLGELLVAMGMLKQAELSEAAQVAVETGLPLGRILIMSNLVNEAQLQAVIQAQSLIKDQLLTIETAAQAVEIVSQTNGTLKQALKSIGWEQQEILPTNKLGEFFIEAGVLDSEQLREAMESSKETGLPLGRILVLKGVISDEILSAALSAQVLVRDKKIDRRQAVQGLKAAKQRRLSIEQSLSEQGFRPPLNTEKVRIGELFVIGGVINERDVMNALELGLMREQPIGEVLVENGLISKTLLHAAIRLQEMVDNGTLNALQAGQVLNHMCETGEPLSKVVAELGWFKPTREERVRLGELLKMAGLVNDDDIQEALRLSLRNSHLVGKILLISGLIDESMLHNALRCQFLLREGFLSQEQAIMALNYCVRLQCSFDDALAELGWTATTRSVPPAEPHVEFDSLPSS